MSFSLTKRHYRRQQIMAYHTSSYVKKLQDGAVNQVVNDLLWPKVVREGQSKNNTVMLLMPYMSVSSTLQLINCKKELNKSTKRRKMPNEIEATDTFTLGSTVTGNISTGSNDYHHYQKMFWSSKRSNR